MYLYDGRGSVSEITQNGQVAATLRYNVYGELLQGAPEQDRTFGYNGKQYTPQNGLQYLRARHYNPAMGTFTTQDTYLGSLRNAMSQNRYTYCENNPVKYSDPSGHGAWINGTWDPHAPWGADTPTPTPTTGGGTGGGGGSSWPRAGGYTGAGPRVPAAETFDWVAYRLEQERIRVQNLTRRYRNPVIGPSANIKSVTSVTAEANKKAINDYLAKNRPTTIFGGYNSLQTAQVDLFTNLGLSRNSTLGQTNTGGQTTDTKNVLLNVNAWFDAFNLTAKVKNNIYASIWNSLEFEIGVGMGLGLQATVYGLDFEAVAKVDAFSMKITSEKVVVGTKYAASFALPITDVVLGGNAPDFAPGFEFGGSTFHPLACPNNVIDPSHPHNTCEYSTVDKADIYGNIELLSAGGYLGYGASFSLSVNQDKLSEELEKTTQNYYSDFENYVEKYS